MTAVDAFVEAGVVGKRGHLPSPQSDFVGGNGQVIIRRRCRVGAIQED
jgi:hypothetical protein